jgi:tungstate transport system substrate-binding protein
MTRSVERRWVVLPLVLALVACQHEAPHLRLATTTSVENSGLLAFLLPVFEQSSGMKVDVLPVGSGKALELARNGDVDMVLTHAPDLEEAFVAAGHGVGRREVMHNDFILIGPPGDAAALRTATSAADALRRIATAKATFVSRGDESGTHQKEKELWKAAGIEPRGDWYLSAGVGMGAVILMANERRAYTLADRGTYLAYRQRGDLEIEYEGDPSLLNRYSVTAVNPERHPGVRHDDAVRLIEWLTSPDGQQRIEAYRKEGQVLFHPSIGGERESR